MNVRPLYSSINRGNRRRYQFCTSALKVAVRPTVAAPNTLKCAATAAPIPLPGYAPSPASFARRSAASARRLTMCRPGRLRPSPGRLRLSLERPTTPRGATTGRLFLSPGLVPPRPALPVAWPRAADRLSRRCRQPTPTRRLPWPLPGPERPTTTSVGPSQLSALPRVPRAAVCPHRPLPPTLAAVFE
jgi:hypothetical protein